MWIMNVKKYVFLSVSVIFPLVGMAQCQLAFPTAEGYGKYTVGGRGGAVYEVTNLNDSGPGSLRAALAADEPRTVVFRVSGTIDLSKPLRIRSPYVTVAGQTAPGGGICIKRYPLLIDADEVIIRYIRVRLGDESGKDYDAISCRGRRNIILDHLSVSWSIDETLSVYNCEDVTIQWCMITESLFGSHHVKGSHGFGGIWGSDRSTYHHNLLAHHSSRNPRFASGVGPNDYRNNVIYNWGYNSCYGGEGTNRDGKGPFSVNMVANYYKAGPATAAGTARYRIAIPSVSADGQNGRWFVDKNFVHGFPAVTADNWNGGVQLRGGGTGYGAVRSVDPMPSVPLHEQTAQEAFAAVLAGAGAPLPERDAVDVRISDEVRRGVATFEGVAYRRNKRPFAVDAPCGIIDSQNDVGGWPELLGADAPLDSDHDGMPDAWESSCGLDPHDAADGKVVTSDGYTNLEHYLNSLAP